MKMILLILLFFSGYLFAQWDGTTNKTIRERDLFGSIFQQALDSANITATIGATSLPDSIVYDSQISDFLSKSTTDTITGQKTFSNSKTVFSGDSVGVRGKLEVDGDIYLATNNTFYLQNGSFGSADYLQIGGFFLNQRGLGLFSGSPFGNTFGIREDNISLQDTADVGYIFQGGKANWSLDLGEIKTGGFECGIGLYGLANRVLIEGDSIIMRGNIHLNGSLKTLTSTITNEQLSYLDGIESNIQDQLDAMVGGSVGNADSLVGIPGQQYSLEKDSLLKVTGSTYQLSYSGSTINDWLGGLNTWTSGLSSSSNVLRLGKSYADRRFNNGAYTDVWIIDYVVPPYNLSSNWLYLIEHRTDYFNDTLKTVSSVANIFNLDGTGTPIWDNNSVVISAVETQLDIGDLPDSTTLDWNTATTIGNNVIISEANLTASPVRFPMPVKGYNFRFGTNDYYTYPRVYSYYSDLTTGTPNLELAYHFYGAGDFPSYFGGDLQVGGDITSGIAISYPDVNTIQFGGDAILLDPATLEISGGILTVVGGTGGGSIDTTMVNDLIEEYINANSDTTIGTAQTIDSLITDYWNDNLGGGAFDSTYAYQRITALEDSIASFRNILNAILTALDTCNCGVVVSGGYSAETLAYETRVEADGGEIISMDAVEAAYASGIDLDNLQLWAGAKFGIKKNANNKVTVLYDLSNNDNDLIQADTSLAPTSFAPDSIQFYRGRYMVSTFNAAATQPITIVMASNFLWKNETGTDQIYDGLDGSNRHNLQNQGTDRDFFAGTDFVSTTSLPSSDVVFTVVTNTTDSLFINNSYATSGDAGSHSLGGIYLNSANGGGASGTQIPLFEILIYDGTGIRATAESNINARWSIY